MKTEWASYSAVKAESLLTRGFALLTSAPVRKAATVWWGTDYEQGKSASKLRKTRQLAKVQIIDEPFQRR